MDEKRKDYREKKLLGNAVRDFNMAILALIASANFSSMKFF